MTRIVPTRIAPLLLSASLIFSAAALAQAPAASSAKATTTQHRTTTTSAGPKIPPGVPVVRGVVRTAFSLRYEDFKIGTGKPAEPGKLYKVHYTGWLASDGKKFDSSADHRRPVLGPDGKPENGPDGKPKLGDPEPIQFLQGRRGVIPGWDQGFAGMKVGGKRRLFIPYQLAYGDLGRPPVIPPKSDLIFDIELVDVTDVPTQSQMPGGMSRPMPGGVGRPMPPRPGTVPNNAPGTPAPPTGTPASQPATPPPANTPVKPVDPTAPTAAPSSASPSATPPPTQPPTKPPTAQPDKPANPEQPN